MNNKLTLAFKFRTYGAIDELDRKRQELVSRKENISISDKEGRGKTDGTSYKPHSSLAMMVALDAKIKETEDKIQACISKRDFKLLESLEAQKTELERQKRDMGPCGSKDTSVADAVCGLMNATDDSVSIEIAEIDERIVALEVAIETCLRDRTFSGLEALDEEKQKLVEEAKKVEKPSARETRSIWLQCPCARSHQHRGG